MQPEQMPPPARWVYAMTAAVVAVAVVLAARRWDTGLVVLATTGLLIAALLPGWLYQRKGYTFAEGWFSGVVAWPLAMLYALFGPRATTPTYRS